MQVDMLCRLCQEHMPYTEYVYVTVNIRCDPAACAAFPSTWYCSFVPALHRSMAGEGFLAMFAACASSHACALQPLPVKR